MSGNPPNGLDIAVYLTVESSEFDMTDKDANVRMYGLVCTQINTALDIQSTARSKMIKDSDRLATNQ
ncbi:hypothetical protein Tco_0259765 [Tanacetum coccineum]